MIYWFYDLSNYSEIIQAAHVDVPPLGSEENLDLSSIPDGKGLSAVLLPTLPLFSPHSSQLAHKAQKILISYLDVFIFSSRGGGFLDWFKLEATDWTVWISVSIEGGICPRHQTLIVTFVERTGVWPPDRICELHHTNKTFLWELELVTVCRQGELVTVCRQGELVTSCWGWGELVTSFRTDVDDCGGLNVVWEEAVRLRLKTSTWKVHHNFIGIQAESLEIYTINFKLLFVLAYFFLNEFEQCLRLSFFIKLPENKWFFRSPMNIFVTAYWNMRMIRHLLTWS